MAFDAHKNFAFSTVLTAPAPALSGTSLVLQAGDGAKFPAAPFNVVIWPTGVQPTAANAEIVRVTAKNVDTLTITRAQEGTAAVSIIIGYQVANACTSKVITDIESVVTRGAVPPIDPPAATAILFVQDNGDVFMNDQAGHWAKLL